MLAPRGTLNLGVDSTGTGTTGGAGLIVASASSAADLYVNSMTVGGSSAGTVPS